MYKYLTICIHSTNQPIKPQIQRNVVVVKNKYQYIKRNKTRDVQPSLPCYPIHFLSVPSSKWKHMCSSIWVWERKGNWEYISWMYFSSLPPCSLTFQISWTEARSSHHGSANTYYACKNIPFRFKFHVALPRKITWLGSCKFLTIC